MKMTEEIVKSALSMRGEYTMDEIAERLDVAVDELRESVRVYLETGKIESEEPRKRRRKQ